MEARCKRLCHFWLVHLNTFFVILRIDHVFKRSWRTVQFWNEIHKIVFHTCVHQKSNNIIDGIVLNSEEMLSKLPLRCPAKGNSLSFNCNEVKNWAIHKKDATKVFIRIWCPFVRWRCRDLNPCEMGEKDLITPRDDQAVKMWRWRPVKEGIGSMRKLKRNNW